VSRIGKSLGARPFKLKSDSRGGDCRGEFVTKDAALGGPVRAWLMPADSISIDNDADSSSSQSQPRDRLFLS